MSHVQAAEGLSVEQVMQPVSFEKALHVLETSVTELAAKTSYQLIFGDCPKSLSCDSSDPLEANQSLMNTLGEDAYLAGLAEIRAESMKCGVTQIQGLEKNPQELEEFTDIYYTSLVEIARLRFRMEGLEPAISSSEQAKREFKAARLKAEAILEGLPYAQTEVMRLMLNVFFSQLDYFKGNRIDPGIEKSFKKQIQTALGKAKNDLAHNKRILDSGVKDLGRSFSKKTRESLAQDLELIEEYRRRAGSKVDRLAPIACSVDAKYGRGADARDKIIFGVSLVGTAAAHGLTKLGTWVGNSSLIGGVAMGAFSVRSAGLLRIVTSLASVGVAVKQIERHCFNGVTLKGHTNGAAANRCETNVVKTLHNNRCVLSVVINAIGAKTVVSDLKKARPELSQTGKVLEAGIKKPKE
jgi:hypothetical protein